MEIKESNFQYLLPRITEFIFNSYSVQGEKSYRIQVTGEKEIKRESQNEATVVLTLKIGSEKESPFTAKITAYSKFRWKGFDEETVQTLLKQNAVVVLISFIRPIIATFTSNAGYSPFYLPLFNFIDDTDEKTELSKK